MKKLSDFKDEQAIDVIADLLEPIGNIATSGVVERAKKSDGSFNKLILAKNLLKECKKDVIEILAVLNETPVEEYHCTTFSVLSDCLVLINDPEITELFGLQGQKETSSTSVSTISEVEE